MSLRPTEKGKSMTIVALLALAALGPLAQGASVDAPAVVDDPPNPFDLFWTEEMSNATQAALNFSPFIIWTNLNDGDGSGLDADLLDGHDSSFFAGLVTNESGRRDDAITNVTAELTTLVGSRFDTAIGEAERLAGRVQANLTTVKAVLEGTIGGHQDALDLLNATTGDLVELMDVVRDDILNIAANTTDLQEDVLRLDDEVDVVKNKADFLQDFVNTTDGVAQGVKAQVTVLNSTLGILDNRTTRLTQDLAAVNITAAVVADLIRNFTTTVELAKAASTAYASNVTTLEAIVSGLPSLETNLSLLQTLATELDGFARAEITNLTERLDLLAPDLEGIAGELDDIRFDIASVRGMVELTDFRMANITARFNEFSTLAVLGGVRLSNATVNATRVETTIANAAFRVNVGNHTNISDGRIRLGTSVDLTASSLGIGNAALQDGQLTVDGTVLTGDLLDVDGATLAGHGLRVGGTNVSAQGISMAGASLSPGLLDVSGTTLDATGVGGGSARLWNTGLLELDGTTLDGDGLNVDGVTLAGHGLNVGATNVSAAGVSLTATSLTEGLLNVSGSTLDGSELRVNGATLAGSGLQLAGASLTGQALAVGGQTLNTTGLYAGAAKLTAAGLLTLGNTASLTSTALSLDGASLTGSALSLAGSTLNATGLTLPATGALKLGTASLTEGLLQLDVAGLGSKLLPGGLSLGNLVGLADGIRLGNLSALGVGSGVGLLVGAGTSITDGGITLAGGTTLGNGLVSSTSLKATSLGTCALLSAGNGGLLSCSGIDPVDLARTSTTIGVGSGLTGGGTLGSDLNIGIASKGIATGMLADAAVTSSKLASGAVGSAAIAGNAIGASHLASGAVGAAAIASGAVGASHLASGAVGAAAIASGAVGASQLATGAVGSAALAANAVGTSAILNGAVTDAKIASLSWSKLSGLPIGCGDGQAIKTLTTTGASCVSVATTLSTLSVSGGANFCTSDGQACGVTFSNDGGMYDYNDGWTTYSGNYVNRGIRLIGAGNNLHAGGNVTAEGFVGTRGLDVAEDYLNGDALVPGELVRIDPTNAERALRTTDVREAGILGVVSTAPGVILSGGIPDEGDESPWARAARAEWKAREPALRAEALAEDPTLAPDDPLVDERARERFRAANLVHVALAGRVPVKVDAGYGAIQPGDILAASPTPGVAMRADSAGPTIGIALEALPAGEGTISMFVQRGELSAPPIPRVVRAGVSEGDVVVMDGFTADGKLKVRPATSAKDPGVVGIVSKQGTTRLDGVERDTPVVVTGIAEVKVVGSVPRGVFLTSAALPGHAMACASAADCAGAILGKALDAHAGPASGTVRVLVTLG